MVFELSLKKNQEIIPVIAPIKKLVIKTPSMRLKKEGKKTFSVMTSPRYDTGKTNITVTAPAKNIIAKKAATLVNISIKGAAINQKTICSPSSISAPKNRNEIQDPKIASPDKPKKMISPIRGGIEIETHVIRDAVK
jgi:hypothetical protein